VHHDEHVLAGDGDDALSARGCRDELRTGRTPEGYIEASPQGGKAMIDTVTYSVPGIHCAKCGVSIREEVSVVEGVEVVDVDLDAKVVTIRGRELSDERLREAIEEAGYEAA
jgi:copper chaperone